MMEKIIKWLKIVYKKSASNIAFLPGLIALLFLILSYVMIHLDFSETGKNLKSNLSWLSLKDAGTARSIITAIVSGIISLTVFSFSMVMIVLNQAASQMSNRVLDKLIGNRYQQIVLGLYIGTIVYALFLLSTIRDLDSGIYVPAISTYLLITLTVVDIFLFIYFLDYITKSIKYETIIHRISDNTLASMKLSCLHSGGPEVTTPQHQGLQVNAYKSGLFQGFDKEALLKLCETEDVVVSFLFPVGHFLLKGSPLLVVSSPDKISKDFEKKLQNVINIYRGQEVSTSYYYGFRQLMEIAIKALSPGINDPGTAVISLWALADLLAYRLQHNPVTNFNDKTGKLRILTVEKTFEHIFSESIIPIWEYGKHDHLVQQEMANILNQLKIYDGHPTITILLNTVQAARK